MTRKKERKLLSYSPDEIIHVKADNDESIFRGQSRLKNLERIFQLYYALISFQQMFFKNNAVPGVVLQTEHVLSDKIKTRILEHWRQKYTAIFDGAKSPAFLDGGLKVDSFSSINFQELDFEQSVNRLEEIMSNTIGVPYILIKSGNNANIGANEVLFYNHTVIPILEQFCSALELFFPGTRIYPDRLAVPALQPDNKTQALYYSTLVNSGLITPNEAREGLRFEKSDKPGMDDIRIPQNITGSAVNPSVGGRPTLKEVNDE